jgi:hypothetical protein
MDPAYGSIFQNLYSAQSETGYLGQFRAAVAPDPQSTRDTEAIRRLIDEAEADLTRSTTQTLRSDARYFLLLNLLQMVFIPFQLHDSPLSTRGVLGDFDPFSSGGTSADLLSALRDDLSLILNDAAGRQAQRVGFQYPSAPQDREISSHLVMEAVVANWSQLKLASFRIWGER